MRLRAREQTVKEHFQDGRDFSIFIGLERDQWNVRFLNYAFVLKLTIRKVTHYTILSEKRNWRICIVGCYLK